MGQNDDRRIVQPLGALLLRLLPPHDPVQPHQIEPEDLLDLLVAVAAFHEPARQLQHLLRIQREGRPRLRIPVRADPDMVDAHQVDDVIDRIEDLRQRLQVAEVNAEHAVAPAAVGHQLDQRIRGLAPHVRRRVMRSHHRILGVRHHRRHFAAVQMADVDQNAQPVAFRDHLPAELAQAAPVQKLVGRPSQLGLAPAQAVEPFHIGQFALQVHRAFRADDRPHLPGRFGGENVIHRFNHPDLVFRVVRDLADVPQVAQEPLGPPLQPRHRVARPRVAVPVNAVGDQLQHDGRDPAGVRVGEVGRQKIVRVRHDHQRLGVQPLRTFFLLRRQLDRLDRGLCRGRRRPLPVDRARARRRRQRPHQRADQTGREGGAPQRASDDGGHNVHGKSNTGNHYPVRRPPRQAENALPPRRLVVPPPLSC
ncbi:MAG: hypothetical protein BWZ08_02693 [candidate division BRC1 bacterium ADurb.BinA292]|nr:MAG: hypothetical protein BWZ08_02693 [candidate division BRC1 bacterium ADurb.BinA292]